MIISRVPLPDTPPVRKNASEMHRRFRGPLMSPIIERNSVLPTSREAVYRTSRDNQDRVEIRIYQGENRYCEDNTYLGKLSLEVPPAPMGQQAVRVRFTYDINGLLEAEAVNAQGRTARLILQEA